MCDEHDFDDFCDDYCDECYEEGYDEGYETARRNSRRSSTSGSSPDGCYIATSVYGSYDCPEVWTLRRFRDEYLMGCAFGRLFVRLYYATSPGLVRRVGGRDFFRKPVKRVLDQFVIHLKNKGYQDTPYDDR